MITIKKALLGLSLVAFTSTAVLAQTNNRVSAKNALDDFQKLQKSNPTAAKGKLLEAKKYIDLAAQHDDTKSDPKTLFYKGTIYMSVAALSGTGDADFTQFDAEKAMEESFNSWKASIKNKNKKDDFTNEITMFVGMMHSPAYSAGIELYKKADYDSARVMFDGCVKFMDILGKLDTNAVFNAGLCSELEAEQVLKKCTMDKKENCPEAQVLYEKAAEYYKICNDAGYNGSDMVVRYSDILIKAGKKDEAKAALTAGKAKYPKSNNLVIQEFNYYLSVGDNESAEKALAEAIKNNPKDAVLYFNAGAIYSDMKRYDDAKKAYENAIAIDAKYFDAYFNLGAMYFNQAADLYNAINDIKDNAVYEKEKVRADELFKSALPWLEKARELNPKDRNNLIMLRTIYARLSMNDKWKEVDTAIKNG